MGRDDTKSSLLFVGEIIAGVLGVVLLVYNLVYAPLSCSLAEECKTRAKDDKDLMSQILDMKSMLSEQKTDIKWIRGKIHKDNDR